MVNYDEINRLVSIISAMREPFNHHNDHVAVYAMRLADALGFSKDHATVIGWGAHLHDIGKLLIRTEILNSVSKLTNVERAEVENHAMLGWAMVNAAGYEETIQEIVRHHHEHWDGTGYPDGLKGEEIPVAARIVSVCDVYEALTNKRSYREAYSHRFAMTTMQIDKGIRFDAQMVDLFFAKVAVEP